MSYARLPACALLIVLATAACSSDPCEGASCPPDASSTVDAGHTADAGDRPDASDPNDAGEPDSGLPCTPTEDHETSCGNATDDDCDGVLDCADEDCAGQVCRAASAGCGEAESCTNGACPADVHVPFGWSTAGTLPAPRLLPMTAVVGGRVLVIGGYGRDLEPVRQVQSFAVEGGAVTDPRDETQLPVPLAFSTVAVQGDRVYLIGGCTAGLPCTGTSPDVYVGVRDATGTLAWVQAGSVPQGLFAASAVFAADTLILVGGASLDEERLANTWTARVGSDGLLGDWVAGPRLHDGRFGHGLALLDDELWVFGGCQTAAGLGCSIPIDDVSRAEVRADGTLGDFQRGPPMPGSMYGFSTLTGGGRIYVVAPRERSAGRRVLHLERDASGARWVEDAPLPRPRDGGAAILHGARVFVFAGLGDTSILAARVEEDGAVGQRTCRSAAGTCDPTEFCDGSSDTCPDDLLATGTICRAAQGPCDVDEACDGTHADCPPDAVVDAGEVCEPAWGPCDLDDVCDGIAAGCAPRYVAAGEECAPADGACDVPDTCTGDSIDCARAFAAADVECRPSAGLCDVPEFCAGNSDACPVDLFLGPEVTCRPAAHPVCDVSESCDGGAAECPPDEGAPALTSCGDLGEQCIAPNECL